MNKNDDKTLSELRRIFDQSAGHVHFTGICGVGMAGLAFLLKNMGFEVTGCDAAGNNLAGWLDRHGIVFLGGHDTAHINDSLALVIRTGAVPETHPEITRAEELGIPTARRGAVLAELADRFFSICVCGTHGKTTTAAMLTQIMKVCGRNPWFTVGAECAGLPGVAGTGDENTLVAEVDESDKTQACYRPDIAVLTNLEFDHAESYRNLAELKDGFGRLIANTKKSIIYCADDPGAADICSGSSKAKSYGFSANADYRLSDPVEKPNSTEFKLHVGNNEPCLISLPVPGRYNALNAAAAFAAACEAGMSGTSLAKAFERFVPARRRFEKIIETPDILLISDYAHHPSEIAATIGSALRLKRKRLFAIFQPHRFSRTKALAQDFPEAFTGIDTLVLLPVYAASEQPLRGGTSLDIYELFRKLGKYETLYADSVGHAWKYIKRILKSGDCFLVVGAGDIEKITGYARRDMGDSELPLPARATNITKKIGAINLRNSDIRFEEPLAPKTTLRVGGTAEVFARVGDPDDLRKLMRWCGKTGAAFRVFGAGSNMLISDAGVDGVTARLDKSSFGSVSVETNTLVAGAATGLGELVSYCLDKEIGGFEFLYGIPGTVGGALRMNAGAMGMETGTMTRWVEYMDRNGHIGLLRNDELMFDYRCCHSLSDVTVIRAGFRLNKRKAAEIKADIDAFAAKRDWMRGLRCAGSVFKNPENLFAGRLLEDAGCKKFRIGGASVSPRHANIIVTENGATASDVLALTHKMRESVLERTGINLVSEVIYLG